MRTHKIENNEQMNSGFFYRLINKLLSTGFRLYHKSMVNYYRGKGVLMGDGFSLQGHVRFILQPTSKLEIGCGTMICEGSRVIVEDGLRMSIGENCYISYDCTLSGGITMGSDCLVGANTMILDADHRFDDQNVPIKDQGADRKAVIIGDDVWIGSGCMILKGTKIGSHAVIGANTTVTGEVPEWSIVTGSRGRVKRFRKE